MLNNSIQSLCTTITDPIVKDTEGRTALHYAAFNGNVDIVKSLLASGADVNAKDNNETTPLHSARSKAVAEILVDNGADIHAVNKNGNTPFLSALHFANESVVSHDNDKSSRCKELLEFLIKCGSNVPEKFTSLLKSIGIDAIAYKEEISPITKFVMENKDNFNNNTNGQSVKNDTNISLWDRITECIKDESKQVMVDILLSADYNSLLCDKLGVDVNIDDNKHAELLAQCLDYEI